MADTTENTTIFIVEDGTCVENANSYVSLEEASQYMTNKNREDWLALTDAEKKASLIKGTQYVDNQFTWKGRRKYYEQNLAFPRVKLIDLDGFLVEGIPKRLKEAVCEAAFYGYQSSVDLFTTHNENGAVKRQKVDVVEVEFFDSTETAVDYISRYAALDALLRGLYVGLDEKANVNAKVLWNGL